MPPYAPLMRVAEAKDLVPDQMHADLTIGGMAVALDPVSPDPRDPGRFVLDGRIARAIHHFSGWKVPINPSWFQGGYDPLEIHRSTFHWYG